MSKNNKFIIPVVRNLNKLGKDISDARKRRRITMAILSERADISRSTLSKIENGDPTTSIGAYASVLFALGLLDNITKLADASNDLQGRFLEEEYLPKRIRLKKKKW